MGKLKARYYLKNNKKRAAILIVSFGLYFALIYSVRFFVNPMLYTEEAVYVDNKDLMQMAYIRQGDKLDLDLSMWEEDSGATDGDKIQELNRAFGEFAQMLQKDNRVDHVIQCYTYGISIQTLIGTANYYVPMVTNKEAQLICDHIGIELIDGTYPMKAGDVVIDERIAKNLNVNVGDRLLNDSTRVCGIAECSSYFAVGIEHDMLTVKRCLLFLDRGTLTDLREFFDEYGWEASNKDTSQIKIIYDLKNMKKAIEDEEKELSQPLNIMVYVITIVMGITLYFVYQLHIKDRYEEWCLYRSLGYSQRDVFGLALREYGICILGSVLLSVLFLLFIFYFGGSMMDSRGIVYRLWLPETLFQLAAFMVFLTGILQIPVVNAMQHIKTIDAIEDDI